MGSIQYLDKGRYRVFIEDTPDKDGKRRRRSKVVRGTRHDAEVELAKMKLDAGKRIDDELTLSEYWAVFYEPTLSRLAPSTQDGYRKSWKRLVEPLFGDSRMSELRARDIERGLLTIEKPGQQRNAFKLMRQMYNEAYRDEMVDENPFLRRIRLSRMEKYQPELLTVDDLPAWIAAVRGSKWEPVLLVMLFGGLRREEACALFWEDFEFGVSECLVRVDKALTETNGKLHEGPTKTPDSTRSVYLCDWPAERLLELAGEGPLVPDANGNRMAPDKISSEYRKMMQKSDAKYVPMRNLRNSYATMMLGMGVSDSLISKSLGHTNLNVDYSHYFAASARAQQANARALGESVRHTLEHAKERGNGRQ